MRPRPVPTTKPTCVLHVGMPKTGTSSIQDSLYHGLSDERFRYVSLGHVNSTVYLVTLFRDRPETTWPFWLLGIPSSRIGRMRSNFTWRLRRALERCVAQGRTPIVSAECCWTFTETELGRMRDFFESCGFGIRAVAYVRPLKSWMESMFQQLVKAGRWDFDPRFGSSPGRSDWHELSRILSTLERVFGRDSVDVRAFVRSQLHEGCAVRDFCRVLGINFDSRAVVRSNDALSADAVTLLCAYNRYCPTRPTWTPLLEHRLRDLGGAPLRFHSSMVADWIDVIEREQDTVRARYGIDISEDPKAHDSGPCIRTQDDLFRHSRSAVEWLASASRSRMVIPGEGEATSREVATQVERLQRQLPVKLFIARAAERARIKLRWALHGD